MITLDWKYIKQRLDSQLLSVFSSEFYKLRKLVEQGDGTFIYKGKERKYKLSVIPRYYNHHQVPMLTVYGELDNGTYYYITDMVSSMTRLAALLSFVSIPDKSTLVWDRIC